MFHITGSNPGFFDKIAKNYTPELLWIGCSDGRVDPDILTGLPLGSIFVHRNIGNVFASNDLNCLAVLQFAVDKLQVHNICRSSIVREAWERGQQLSVHGLVYSVHNGLLKPICKSVSSIKDWESFQSADALLKNRE